jgi:hypothetical protein
MFRENSVNMLLDWQTYFMVEMENRLFFLCFMHQFLPQNTVAMTVVYNLVVRLNAHNLIKLCKFILFPMFLSTS